MEAKTRQAITTIGQHFIRSNSLWLLIGLLILPSLLWSNPPKAYDDTININPNSTIVIQLDAQNDPNFPDPNYLDYTITSLPDHAVLSEPNGIIIDSVPYTLSNGSSQVGYEPCPYFVGEEDFQFEADGGNSPSTGGISNTATVTVIFDLVNSVYKSYATNSNYYDTLFMDTGSFYDARSRVIYLQNDIGSAKLLTDMSLDIAFVPGRTLGDFTVRMQHVDWDEYNHGSAGSMFLTTGWTTVYRSNFYIGSTGWRNIPFQTPFAYNGTQNLLVDFCFNNTRKTSPGGGYTVNSLSTFRVLSLASATGSHGDPLNWNLGSTGGSYYYSGGIPSFKLWGSVLPDPLLGDLNASCDVTMPDFVIFANAWLTQFGDAQYNADCDLALPQNQQINIADFQVFVDQWLEVY